MAQAGTKESVRDALLNAADGLYRRYGYKKTTVEDIADAARMSRGTVYLYFRSKEEIALAWMDRFCASRCDAMRAVALSEGSPTDRLRSMLGTRVLTAFEHGQNYTQSLDEVFSALRPALLELRGRNHEAEAAILADVLLEGRAAGLFAFRDALETARLLVLVTNPLLPYSLSTRQLGERAEIEARLAALLDMILTGLYRRPIGTQTNAASARLPGADVSAEPTGDTANRETMSS